MTPHVEIFSPENLRIILLVHAVLQDPSKTHTWLHIENPNFGGVSPVSMMLRGRSQKVLKFVEGRLEENSL